MAPTLVPEVRMPTANARSLRGNHSDTALIAAGKLPDSPNPSRARMNRKLRVDWAAAWPMAARLQTTMHTA
ncbi:hypothetical protein D3C80_1629160 [compost metagenome]